MPPEAMMTADVMCAATTTTMACQWHHCVHATRCDDDTMCAMTALMTVQHNAHNVDSDGGDP